MKQKKTTTNNISKGKKPARLFQNNFFAFNLILFASLIVSIIRLKFLNIPLERDEGEYAYMAQLLLQGSLPYTETYSMKLPGIYLIYAGILLIFGQSHAAIHSALLLTNILTAVLIFLIGRRLYDNIAGAVASSAFLVMTLSPSVLGLWAHATHFIIFFTAAGLLLTLESTRKNSLKLLFISGLLLGFVPLIKHHGIFFLLFGIFFLSWTYLGLIKKSFGDFASKIGLFIIAAILPYCFILGLYLLTGNFNNFWIWTIQYPIEYISLVPISDGLKTFKANFLPILKNNITIFLIFIAGVGGIFYYKKRSAAILFCYGFFIASFASIIPGLYFRPHYFIALIPAVCLFAGIGISAVINKFHNDRRKIIPILLITIVLLICPLILQYDFFKLSTHMASRYAYGYEPFPESIDAANFLIKNTTAGDRIAVLGSEPQIYFYSKRKSVTGYIYMYSLTEPQPFALRMQKEFIQGIENNPPKYIVLATSPSSWLFSIHSEKLLYNWLHGYVDANYTPSVVYDIISPEKTEVKSGSKAASYKTRSPSALIIFKRKDLN